MLNRSKWWICRGLFSVEDCHTSGVIEQDGVNGIDSVNHRAQVHCNEGTSPTICGTLCWSDKSIVASGLLKNVEYPPGFIL